jgi:hypothetical protein
MLPFLKPKKLASTIITNRMTSDGKTLPEKEETHPDLLDASSRLVSGIHAKDAQQVADAMQSIHEHFMAKSAMDSDKTK